MTDKNFSLKMNQNGELMQSQSHLHKLTKAKYNIWKSVIEAAGGEFVPNDYISVSQNDDTTDELPSVSIVNIPSDDPIVFEPEILEQPEQEEENAFEEPVILGESQIQFVGGKATYLDEESATETIRPIAESIHLSHMFPLHSLAF